MPHVKRSSLGTWRAPVTGHSHMVEQSPSPLATTWGYSEMGQPIIFIPPVCHLSATDFGRIYRQTSWWGTLGCLLVMLTAACIPICTWLIIKGAKFYCLDHFGYRRTENNVVNSNGARFTGFVRAERRVGWNYCSWEELCFRICPRY